MPSLFYMNFAFLLLFPLQYYVCVWALSLVSQPQHTVADGQQPLPSSSSSINVPLPAAVAEAQAAAGGDGIGGDGPTLALDPTAEAAASFVQTGGAELHYFRDVHHQVFWKLFYAF